jgi:hypothetical protein
MNSHGYIAPATTFKTTKLAKLFSVQAHCTFTARYLATKYTTVLARLDELVSDHP